MDKIFAIARLLLFTGFAEDTTWNIQVLLLLQYRWQTLYLIIMSLQSFILYSYLIVEIVEFDIFQLKSVISQHTFEKPIILKLQFLKELIFTSIKIILMFILPKVHQHFVTILIMNKNWMCSRWLFYFYLEHCQWLVITGIIRHLVPGLRTVTKRSLLDWRSRSWCWRCDCDGWSVGCVIRNSKQPPWN